MVWAAHLSGDMMKIVGPNRTGTVQSMGRHSVGNTGHEGRAQLAGVIGEVGSKLAFQFADQIDKRQQQKADLRMQKEDNNFWLQWGDQEFFNVKDLPSDVVTEGMELEGRISSAEVLPMMYEDHIKRQLSESSKMIDIPGSRQSWMLAREKTAIGRLTSIQKSAYSTLSAQHYKDQQFNYSNALEARRPDVAKEVARGMDISDDLRKEYLLQADQSAEVIRYEDILSETEDPETRLQDLREASTFLGLGAEDYEKEGGYLDPTRKLAWKSKLDGEISRITNVSTSENKYVKAQLEHDIQTQVKLSDAGYAIDEEILADLAVRIRQGNERTDGDYAKEALTLQQAAIYGVNVNYMNKQHARGRWEHINKVRTGEREANLSQLERDNLVRRLTASNEAFTRNLNKDFMGTVLKAGAFGPQGLSPIDINASPGDLSSQISIRDQQYAIAQQNYGTDLGGGMLTVEEAQTYGHQINSMSTQRQLSVIEAANNAMGPRSVEFFQQIGKDGDASTFSIAGIAQSAGWSSTARSMLDGRKWRLENGKELGTMNKLLDARITKDLGNAYINQPEKRRAVHDAVKDSYYGIRQSGMDLTTQSLDGDDFDNALRMATGGLWEHGGKLLPVPEYGMALDTMPRWIQDTNWEHFKDNHPEGYPAETFWNDVQAGRLTLEPYREPGTYTVSRNGNALPGATVDAYGRRVPYLLRYDSSAEKSPGYWNQAKDVLGSIFGSEE